MRTTSFFRWALIFYICAPVLSHAQDRAYRLWIGLDGASMYGRNTSAFDTCTCAPRPIGDKSSATGYVFGASFEWRSESMFSPFLHVGYASQWIDETSTSSPLPYVDTTTGEVKYYHRIYEAHSEVKSIVIDMLGKISFGRPHLGLGLSAMMNLSSTIQSSFHYDDKFIASQSLNAPTVTIPPSPIPGLTSTALGATLSAGYDFHLADDLMIVPDVALTIPLTEMATDFMWKQLYIRASLSVKMGFFAMPTGRWTEMGTGHS